MSRSVRSGFGPGQLKRGTPLRAVARLSEQALLQNYRKIRASCPGQRIQLMVKADAYGHGVDWVVPALADEPALQGFGVATLDEGIEVRSFLRGRRDLAITVFSGATPWQGDEQGEACVRNRLTPVLTRIEDWRAFHGRQAGSRSWSRRLPFELKFNSGMNRLGIALEHLQEVRCDLIELAKEGRHPSGILSHLAIGENSEDPLSQRQQRAFETLKRELAPVLPDAVDFHLANSAAIRGRKKWRTLPLTTRVRPGLALYGIEPEGRGEKLGVKPVMNLEAPVIAIHHLEAGDAVGYGARYRVRRRQTVAILGVGYAEGVHRQWSHSGSDARVLLGGHLEKFAGSISMDLSAVTAGPKVRIGDWARLFGEGIDPWLQASAAGTIPYELLTSITRRVQRIHG